MLAKYNSGRLKAVKLLGSYSNNPIANEGAVATGCSGGVDSFYTIIKHVVNNMGRGHRLTHLLFASCGTLDNKTERIEAYYNSTFPKIKEIANAMGCRLIGCYTNLHEFYKFPYEGFCNFYATIYGSVVYAVQKLVSVYYISSGDPITEFTLELDRAHGYDGSIFDVFSVGCMQTETLTFYSAGMEKSRIEKMDYIVNNPVAQKYLTVCGRTVSGGSTEGYPNCGICGKCLRTIIQLYYLNALGNFEKVFDLSDFYSPKNKRIGKMLAINKKTYIKEKLVIAQKNNIKFGIKPYLWKWFWYQPLKTISKIFRENRWAKKIYYKFNLDYKLHGYRNAKYEAYKEKL